MVAGCVSPPSTHRFPTDISAINANEKNTHTNGYMEMVLVLQIMLVMRMMLMMPMMVMMLNTKTATMMKTKMPQNAGLCTTNKYLRQ